MSLQVEVVALARTTFGPTLQKRFCGISLPSLHELHPVTQFEPADVMLLLPRRHSACRRHQKKLGTMQYPPAITAFKHHLNS